MNTLSASEAAPSDQTAPGTPDPSARATTDLGPIERLHLAASLDLLSRRLTEVEKGLQPKPTRASVSSYALELIKVVFGGWPAFGLLFIVLFYAPLRDAINAIPQKVRDAEEIGVLGVSLKTTIRVEAEKIGALQLSETLPTLSPESVEFLLRGVAEQNSLLSFSLDSKDANLVTTLIVPTSKTISVLRELEAKKLIGIRIGPSAKDESVRVLEQELTQIRSKYPSTPEPASDDTDRVRLRLLTPVSFHPPALSWRQTDLGKSAVSVILKAVAAQLSPKASAQSKKSAFS